MWLLQRSTGCVRMVMHLRCAARLLLTKDNAAQRFCAAAECFVTERPVISGTLGTDANIQIHDICYSGIHLRSPARPRVLIT